MTGPDFMCIGAQKAATGWLYEQLRDHPDFWMPPLKELHYFDRLGRSRREMETKTVDRVAEARRTARDERDLRFLDAFKNLRAHPHVDLPRYAGLFEPKGELISGDVTPAYSTLEEPMVEKIVRHFPKLKVIFIARDPVERAWSQLSMWVRHRVIAPFPENDFDAVTQYLQRPEIRSRSHPAETVRRWRRYVSGDSFGLYFFDDLQARPGEVRRAMIEFLGADPSKPSGKLAIDHNPKAKKGKVRLTDEMRRHVAKFFAEELKACATELGGPAMNWPRRYGL